MTEHARGEARRDGLIAKLTVLIRHHGSGLALVPAGRLCFGVYGCMICRGVYGSAGQRTWSELGGK
jgi:hypothetical protein